MVRIKEASNMERWRERVSGSGGLNASGLGAVEESYQEPDVEVVMSEPLRVVRASAIRE